MASKRSSGFGQRNAASRSSGVAGTTPGDAPPRPAVRGLAQRLRIAGGSRQRVDAAFRHPAQRLPGQQPAAGLEVQHQAVAAQAGRIQHAVAQLAQPFAGAGDGALQPALPGRVLRAKRSGSPAAPSSLGLQHGGQLRLAPARDLCRGCAAS